MWRVFIMGYMNHCAIFITVANFATKHNCHPEMSRMKSLTRSFVWLLNIDHDIEIIVKSCHECTVNQKNPSAAPIHAWEYPFKPWERTHIDYARPFLNKMFLIELDSFWKWIDVVVMNNSTSVATTEQLRKIFATHGLPLVIFSDNGPCFTSAEFQLFVNRNKIKHLYTAPYHSCSNWQTERTIQTVKNALKKMNSGIDYLETKVSRFLFSYRITPQSTTSQSPAKLLCNCQLRSAFTLIKPDTTNAVRLKQFNNEYYSKRNKPLRYFMSKIQLQHGISDGDLNGWKARLQGIKEQ